MENKLITSATVRELCGGISDMSLWRWINNEELHFPSPLIISRRRYWREADVFNWIEGRAINPDATRGLQAVGGKT